MSRTILIVIILVLFFAVMRLTGLVFLLTGFVVKLFFMLGIVLLVVFLTRKWK